MVLYDKKDDSIDIYNVKAKLEELKKYRKNVIQRHKDENMFYSLRTNSEETISRFKTAKEIDIRFLQYENSSALEVGSWSDLEQMTKPEKWELEEQKEILERYINGEYNLLVPTRTFEFIWQDDLDCTIHRLLKPSDAQIISNNSHGNVWKIKNMLNLPKQLYLLHLLEQGKFNQLTNEDIKRQLQLFDITYSRNVSIEELQNMYETGLFNGDLENSINKAEIGTKILQKNRIKK